MRYIIFLLLSLSLTASTLHLATYANPSRINPILATDSSSSEIAGHIFNGLIKYDKNSSTIIGDLAEEFFYEDKTTLVFKLKQNVTWHDGEKFTAQDVLFTYETIMSPKVVSPYSANFRFVKYVQVVDDYTIKVKYKQPYFKALETWMMGVLPYHILKDETIMSPKVVSPYSANFRFVKYVQIVDDYTIKVKYKQPYFKALETWMMGILPYHILKDETNLMNAKFNTDPIGTGPYKLHQLEHSKNIILVAYDEYFEGRPKIDRISFHVIGDPMTRFLMLKSTSLDIGSVEPMQFERQLSESFFENFNIYEEISRSYTYLGFNLRRNKFKNPKVRQALSLAINRDEIVKILFFEHAKVCTGPFLPRTKAFNPDVKAPIQDIEEAKRLLKEAGYDENNPFTFEIVTSNSNAIRPYAAQIMQHQLKKVGVVVTLRVMEWQAFLNMVVFPNKFDSVLLGWGLSPTPDPYLFWHSDNDRKGGFNLVGYKNEKIDKMIEESQSIIDREKLSVMWKEMFKIITDDNPYLFLYIPNSITAASKKIKNVEPSLSGIWHNYIKWEKDTYK